MGNKEVMEKVTLRINNWFKENHKRMIAISDKIWDIAEVKFEEFQSMEVLVEEFIKEGFKIKTDLVKGLPTAFIAEWSNGEGPIIGLIGEYDALPSLGHEISTTKTPNGKNGHGCGHNLLGTASMSAAFSAAKAMEELDIKGTIRYFGCPAEEGGGAKVFMVRDGVFDGLDAIVRWHPSNATYVSMSPSLAIRSIRYTFHGKTAHAGTNPHLGRSALDAALLMDVGVNYMRERVPTHIRMSSVISNGGEAPNIVPDKAEIWYQVRAPKQTEIDEIVERIDKIANGMAMATETTVEGRTTMLCSETLPNKVLCNRMLINLERVGPPKFTEEDKQFAKELSQDLTVQEKSKSLEMFGIKDPEIGKKDLYDEIFTDMSEGKITPYSTDSGDVSWQAPMCQVFVASQNIGSANHSWQQVVCSGMGIGHKGMLCAGETIAMTTLDILTDSKLLEDAKKEYNEAIKLNPYINPLPTDLLPGTE